MRYHLYLKLLLLGVSSLGSSLYTPSDQKVLESSEEKFRNIRNALKNADIIDEVTDDFKPKCFLDPFYGKYLKQVILGTKLDPSEVQQRPSLKISCPTIQSTSGFTAILTDPDAPSRDNPKWAEMCHWIEIIPTPDAGLHGLNMDFGLGMKQLVEYKPPGPPAKTGYHRYIFLLLEGNNANLTAPEERQHWGTGKERHGVRDWAQREGLQVIGANFFIARSKKQ